MLEYLIFSFVIPLAFFAKPSKTDFNGYVGYNIQMLDCRNKDTVFTRGNVKYEKEVKKQKKETEKREKERDRIEKELGIVRC